LILVTAAAAQDVPTTLQVDLENWVNYAYDVTDLSKLARSPGPVASAAPANFSLWLSIADVTAINGSPAKGTVVFRNQVVGLTPTPASGQAIGDIVRGSYQQFNFELLKPDGGVIGNIYVMGLNGGTPPPGSDANAISGNFAIVGGTGAFVGVRGTVSPPAGNAPRSASQTEDPSMRRINGGGKGRFLLRLWPMFRPEVVTNSIGPLILHSDWTQVTSSKPAQRGEVLIAIAKGLGPTLPGVNPGDPFPSDPFAVITSPIDVLVGGKAAPAINQVGYPGATDAYHISFRVPDTASVGTVSIQLSAAWVRGTAVSILVR
jgi:uncharacterized protein (TIGR03437 family)